MASLGEADLQVSSTIVGKIRALNIFPESALFPRLGILVGVTLHERPEASFPNRATQGTLPLTDYEMRDASGELRLSEHGDVVGRVFWAGPRRFVRSTSYGDESQLRFVCDLDPWCLEQIERRRDGAPPRFWLQIWPILVKQKEFLDGDVRAFEMRIPREQWLEFYGKAGGASFDVLEIKYPSGQAVGRSVKVDGTVFPAGNTYLIVVDSLRAGTP